MKFNLTLAAGPVNEPLTVMEIREHLRIDSWFEDAVLLSFRHAARHYAEDILGRALITQSWTLKLDAFPPVIRLPRPPLQSVTSVAYTDTNGDPQTLNPSLYSVHTGDEPGFIVPAFGESWPATRNHPNVVTVTFVAGYGDDATDIPESIRAGLKLFIAHLYEFREPVIAGTIAVSVPMSVDALWAPYRHRFVA